MDDLTGNEEVSSSVLIPLFFTGKHGRVLRISFQWTATYGALTVADILSDVRHALGLRKPHHPIPMVFKTASADQLHMGHGVIVSLDTPASDVLTYHHSNLTFAILICHTEHMNTETVFERHGVSGPAHLLPSCSDIEDTAKELGRTGASSKRGASSAEGASVDSGPPGLPDQARTGGEGHRPSSTEAVRRPRVSLKPPARRRTHLRAHWSTGETYAAIATAARKHLADLKSRNM